MVYSHIIIKGSSLFRGCPVIQNPKKKETDWSFKSKKKARDLLLTVIVGQPLKGLTRFIFDKKYR